jgi:hypothetical protein
VPDTDLDVLVIGEVLVEISGRDPLDERAAATVGLVEAVRLGAAAASLSVGALGGTGHVPTLDRIRAHARTADLATQGALS